MRKTYVPTPVDEQQRMESSITKTSTFNGSTFDNGSGFNPGGVGKAMGVVVNITAGDFTTGDETYTFTYQESDDNSTFNAAGPDVTADTAAGVVTPKVITVPGFVSKRYTRLKCTIAGTTPTITYEAWQTPQVST